MHVDRSRVGVGEVWGESFTSEEGGREGLCGVNVNPIEAESMIPGMPRNSPLEAPVKHSDISCRH